MDRSKWYYLLISQEFYADFTKKNPAFFRAFRPQANVPGKCQEIPLDLKPGSGCIITLILNQEGVPSMEKIKKNFGFGCMRLPMQGEEVDLDETKRMVDAFLAAGFNYFDTALRLSAGQERAGPEDRPDRPLPPGKLRPDGQTHQRVFQE